MLTIYTKMMISISFPFDSYFTATSARIRNRTNCVAPGLYFRLQKYPDSHLEASAVVVLPHTQTHTHIYTQCGSVTVALSIWKSFYCRNTLSKNYSFLPYSYFLVSSTYKQVFITSSFFQYYRLEHDHNSVFQTSHLEEYFITRWRK